MARGRHAAAAAKRRAESAEQQLDRLMPQLVDAKRIAAQNRSTAYVANKRSRDVLGNNTAWMNPTVADAIAVLPEGSCDDLITAFGYDRDERRLLSKRGSASDAMREYHEEQVLSLTRIDPIGMTLAERRRIVANCEAFTGRPLTRNALVIHPKGRAHTKLSDEFDQAAS